MVELIEGQQNRQNRVPAVVSACDDSILPYLLVETAFERLFDQIHIAMPLGHLHGELVDVDDEHLLLQPQGDQVLRKLRELVRHESLARLHQNLQPESESIGVERLVLPRPSRHPEVLVEHVGELLGRGQ